MIKRLETESDQVKGLSFHSKRPWILAGLSSGLIELWDYLVGCLVGTFDQHDRKPVWSVHFHPSRPLFVSGGEDLTIKVWDSDSLSPLFTLIGHTMRVRIVQFHHDQPWILSAGDDYPARIWNWESRTCVSLLRHPSPHFYRPYTCASFHPKEDLVAIGTGSGHFVMLDVSGLRTREGAAFMPYVKSAGYGSVNWLSFHPTLPLLVTCSNGPSSYIWHLTGYTAYLIKLVRDETKKIHAQSHMLTCVLFSARQNILLSSSSQDKTLQVWDANLLVDEYFQRKPTNSWPLPPERKVRPLHTFRRDNYRFRTLALHPNTNLLAAGLDTGMIVFKLERERPPFCVIGDSLVYVKDQYVRMYTFSTGKDAQILRICPPASKKCLNQGPRALSYSPMENAVLVCSDEDGGSHRLHIAPKDGYDEVGTITEANGGAGRCAVFVARKKFAVLEKSTNKVLVKDLQNKILSKADLPFVVDTFFYAGAGNLLCCAAERAFIFSLRENVVMGNLHLSKTNWRGHQASFIRYAIWSPDMEMVALLSKHAIVLADKELVHKCSVNETIPVKSGAWDDNGVFIYNTSTHIKYCLPNGDTGIIKCLHDPVYIIKIFGTTVFCLDRGAKIVAVRVDPAEYCFKLSFMKRRYDQVVSISRNSKLFGRATIAAYLQQKGYPEVALHLLNDRASRFKLELQSRNMHVAAASAKKFNENNHRYRLGANALLLGYVSIAEDAYKGARDSNKLSFLYLITGNLEKFSTAMQFSESEDDVGNNFCISLCLGDVRQRIKILESAGHVPLAYVTAIVHGLLDIADRLASNLGDKLPCLPKGKTAALLVPPSPILGGKDWPSLVDG